jgi:hypothetical protein
MNSGQLVYSVIGFSQSTHNNYRMLFGAPDEFGELSYSSCLRYWGSIDSGFSRGYPMDLLYFTESQDGLVLHVPSADVTLIRRLYKFWENEDPDALKSGRVELKGKNLIFVE